MTIKVPLLMLVIIMIIITRVILINYDDNVDYDDHERKEHGTRSAKGKVNFKKLLKLSESCMHCAFNLQISQLSVADINQIICR